jgi:para-nitrobenzyl esterase
MRPLIPVMLSLALAAGCRGRDDATRPTPDTSLSRKTTSGEVVGFVGPYGSATWLGIPYAAPPVGDLRWRAPQPAPRWTGARETLVAGSPCVQYASPFGGMENVSRGQPAGSEDCLVLNVYAPHAATPASRLPVMVWIHGGGNTVGHAGFYDGGHLAERENVVVVMINYRLGPFGWFRHAALRGDGTSDLERSGNFGILDQIRALEWVRDNIAAFGGDPGNVTVFGESAGGRDTFALLVSPPARGLFHRAIVESGVVGSDQPAIAEGFVDDPVPSKPNAAGEALIRLLIADGSARDRATAKAKLAAMSPQDIAHYLRAQSAVDVLRAYPPYPNSELINLPQMFADGAVLPSGDILAALGRSDAHQHVPVMIGTNRDENKLFMFGDPAQVRWWLGIVPRLRDPAGYQIAAEYLARWWKATGADAPAQALGASQREPVFVYRFDWDEEPTILGSDFSQMLGAAHAFEVPFVFGHFDLGRDGNRLFTEDNRAGREALSEQMMGYWAQFARTGDPGRGTSDTSPAWLPWQDVPRYMVLDTPAGGGSRLSTEGETRESLIAAIDADPRLPTQRDKCRIFRTLAGWSPSFTREQYASAGAHGCADYPFDGYPWSG